MRNSYATHERVQSLIADAIAILRAHECLKRDVSYIADHAAPETMAALRRDLADPVNNPSPATIARILAAQEFYTMNLERLQNAAKRQEVYRYKRKFGGTVERTTRAETRAAQAEPQPRSDAQAASGAQAPQFTDSRDLRNTKHRLDDGSEVECEASAPPKAEELGDGDLAI